ncbi:dethiobiotin synthase [Pseudobacter ginsenosidimutans]|jgi:dethiobiotin synthetase|uniref:ATP-dependent dethiobiotin synthetase BioD n=1 Tax=Pseudobacter ginsenosidimutans TaxID=661488 RepID=A0A4Q7N2P2_9BACT|nr:dethiobiotin synthase [Pseudobacter ginsenosidimutans]QEC43750.1 dethiobiotin synthase [Pseudobacter ginsenosidimutans]RZS75164.1 dethiobiotin synthetase [Pseudobacter ginsenosidimutans]
MNIFVTGIGTGVGKTLVSAILTRALEADYWKPVQAGFDDGTDSEFIQQAVKGTSSVIHPETYKFWLPASPHIAARKEGINISIEKICASIPVINRNLIIEGAGGLMVPLNEKAFVADLIKALNAKVILVSRNYLGSINHSLLTAKVCRDLDLPVIGWIFNDQFLDYEEEIVRWSNIPKIATVPYSETTDGAFINSQAAIVREALKALL